MRFAVVLVLVGGCSLVLTSATPHHATPGGPPTGCDSLVWPIGDFVLAPTAVGAGGVLLVGMNVESGGGPEASLVPAFLITTGVIALVSGITGLSRIGRCSDHLPRAAPSRATPDPARPAAPVTDDDARPSWGE